MKSKDPNEKFIVFSGLNKAQYDLVQAARRIFLRHGYGATTMASIAKEAGISKQLARYYYKDPAELLHLWMKAWGESGQMVTLKTLATHHSKSGHDKILLMNKAIHDWIDQFPSVSKLTLLMLDSAQYNKETHTLLVQILNEGMKRILDFLLLDTPKIPIKALQSRARGLHFIMIGGALHRLALGGEKTESLQNSEWALKELLTQILGKTRSESI
jgi:AcrR family transcriptional regulator